ncbi:LOW QUALITY PROTEIN: cilia- and flagella-associated protein 206 [Chelonus insularis]|uniref:LOW QUALITY PROTEIN: cilia- and flagella-associated protein 206 n=1 Tax=Chelonus insularis TaxID=460826 RepID=UPI00158AAFF2|nr:LOW QUALITY PROTEIN: cilia- and flagella-associated protein 206-like [Chelonus insularis]
MKLLTLVNLYQLNSEWKIQDDDDYDKLISVIVTKLLEKGPSIKTIEMQLFFTKNYLHKNEIIKKFRHGLERKTVSLMNEICETTRVNTDRDIDKLYQKILTFIIYMSGLGNPANSGVLKEATMCLQSVYLPSEVTHFVNLSRKAKDKQLKELMSIVGGIRIFNKDCQRGGHSIDDLPSLLQDNFEKLKLSIFQLLEKLMRNVNRLTTAVENFLDFNFILSDEEKNNFTCIIETLTAYRQQEIYVRKLLSDIETSENEYKSLIKYLQARLTNLHETVKFRTAIPIVQVYPQFSDLMNIWMHLQDERAVLDSLNSFLFQLKNINIEDVEIHDEGILERLLKDSEILSDADRLEKSMGKSISECENCHIIFPNTMSDLQKIQLEFVGFCAWTFVVCPGALIPGNPNIGIIKWRMRYFVFSSDEAARKFGQDPNKFFYDALNFVRQHPEYINLFQLHEEIEAINNQEKSSEEYNLKFHQDQAIQTDVHFHETYIDPDYSHSIWDYRQKAMKLVHISRCRTKSTQTRLSHYRKSSNVQVSLSKDMGVQTRKDNYCNTILNRSFMWGLRGIRNFEPQIVTYTNDF